MLYRVWGEGMRLCCAGMRLCCGGGGGLLHFKVYLSPLLGEGVIATK